MPQDLQVALRPYQIHAVERVRSLEHTGVRRIVLVAPTGAGKTTIAGKLITDRLSAGQRVLFVAHRRELINQAYARVRQLGVAECDVGVVMSADRRRRPGAPLQVASIDTLRHRAKPLADLVILDECHRALAPSNRALQTHYDRATHIGLTATPFRADGRGLGHAYDELVVVAQMRDLIAEGFLVEPTVFSVPERDLPDLRGVRTRRGDYDPTQLAAAVDKRKLVGDIVAHWQELAADLRTVVFATSVQHSQHIARRFREAGIAAEHLDGTTPTGERDAILGRLEAGATRVVSSVAVLTEGWDQPSVKCAILAKPTKSLGLYLQQVGRILRPWQDSRAVILDHAGCVRRHGPPHKDRHFTLADAPKQQARSASADAPMIKCPACGAPCHAACRVCPHCQRPLSGGLAEADGRLVQVSGMSFDFADGGDPADRALWNDLCETAIRRGFKPGWVFYRFKERTGRKPPRGFRPPTAAVLEAAHMRDRITQAARTRGYIGWDEL